MLDRNGQLYYDINRTNVLGDEWLNSNIYYINRRIDYHEYQ